jgi:hypothetical protein
MLKKFALEGNKSKVVRTSVLTYESGPHFKKSLRNTGLADRSKDESDNEGDTNNKSNGYPREGPRG